MEIQNLNKAIQQMEEIHSHTAAERDHLFKVSHEYKDEVGLLKERLREAERDHAAFSEAQAKYAEVSAHCQRLQERSRMYEAKLWEAVAENERLSSMLKAEREARAGTAAELQRAEALSVELTNRTEEAREWEQKYGELYAKYKAELGGSRSMAQEYQNRYRFGYVGSLHSTDNWNTSKCPSKR
jgi:chromosome segregation ATPase